MDEYRDILTRMLGEKRLRHSFYVEKRAVELAERHGAGREQARLAGLLHDICHDMPKREQLQYLAGCGILLDKFYGDHPPLWHAICGAAYLEHDLGITDRAVLDAVRYHTTGRRDMAPLEKIVFLADATSEERSYPGVEERRALADADLDSAMLAFLRFELGRLAEKGQPIVREAWEAYNYFVVRAAQSGK